MTRNVYDLMSAIFKSRDSHTKVMKIRYEFFYKCIGLNKSNAILQIIILSRIVINFSIKLKIFKIFFKYLRNI